MRDRLLDAHARVLGGRRFVRLNRFLAEAGLRGLGILNYKDARGSGEGWLVRQIASTFGTLVVLDVGANVGTYAAAVLEASPDADIHAFEPHPGTFERLQRRASTVGFTAVNLACGDRPGTLELFDYAGSASGTEHASIHKAVIEQVHGQAARSWTVGVTTVDRYLDEVDLPHVNLLKVDTEGHEYAVLLGAQGAMARGHFDLIQFEFNEMNIVARRFMLDFFELLEGFSLFRLLPDGLLPIMSTGEPLLREVYAFQNVVAVRASLLPTVATWR